MAAVSGDIEPVTPAGRSDNVVPLHPARQARPPETVTFNRLELNRILHVYGVMVAAGEWRDYAIDMLADRAVFSVYRRSAEYPLYRIEKRPALARRQGAWSIVGADGQTLKRGHELEALLRFFERRPKLVQG